MKVLDCENAVFVNLPSPLRKMSAGQRTPTISHYGPKNNSFFVSTSAQSKGTWTATHYAILSNKNDNFSHYFLVLDGVTSVKNAKFRGYTYVQENAPT